MTTDAIWLAVVLLFFGSFAVTLFTVALWSRGAPTSRVSVKTTGQREPNP